MTDQIPAGEPSLGSLACPEPEDRPDLWPTTAQRTDDGELVLGGLTVSEILAEAPSPVFVLDEADLRGRAASWAAAMHEEFWPSYGMAGGEAFYAGKAFLTTKVAQWVLEEGMGIDTASRGELAVSLAALQEVDGEEATTDATRLGLHASGVYGPEETGKVMVRLTTGVHAGGHEYISTGHEDQKFGLSVHGGAARQAIDAIIAAPELELHGLHSHIGSQILDLAGFREAVGIVLTLRHEVAVDTGHLCPEVDLGGGYGIAYTGADPVPPSPAEVARTLAETVRELCTELGDPVPHVSVEPGRSVAGPSTVMLYTVSGLKRVELGEGASRLYVSVDGGMSDNIRPALYEAAYTALVANRRPDPQAGLVRSRVVGKHCESGDVVVRDVDLPADLAVGDVLAVPATGAYGRSMASNYNLFTRPGVRWVREGESGWILRPETIEDLLRLEG